MHITNKIDLANYLKKRGEDRMKSNIDTLKDDIYSALNPAPEGDILSRRVKRLPAEREEAALDWHERLSACHEPDVYGSID